MPRKKRNSKRRFTRKGQRWRRCWRRPRQRRRLLFPPLPVGVRHTNTFSLLNLSRYPNLPFTVAPLTKTMMTFAKLFCWALPSARRPSYSRLATDTVSLVGYQVWSTFLNSNVAYAMRATLARCTRC